ncbi:MAG: hypothetical protein CL489_11615 [Acidobacteria bacterium]|nr:hypothetical protein [Acidobacteriota bacterium]
MTRSDNWDKDEDETKDLNENHISHEDWRDDFDVGLNRLDGFVRFVEETKNHEEQKMIIDSEALAKMMELNILMLQIALRNEFRLGVLEGKKGNDSSHEELGKSEMDKIMDIQVDLNKYKEIWEKQHRQWNLKKAVMEDKHEKASKAARRAEKK